MLLTEKLKDYRLLLGSGSPRRRELMAGCGFDFEVIRLDIEEIYPPELPAEEVAPYLAGLKSEGYTVAEDEILVTADTVVVLDGKVLGKPAGEEEAGQMLKMLSGRTHRVVSGVVIRSSERQHLFSATTDVTFRELSDEEILWYVSEYRPFDKAGAYGVQEWIGYAAVERINGSFYNVMGLPIEQLYVELDTFLS